MMIVCIVFVLHTDPTSKCLGAFLVLLTRAGNGNGWYTSTRQLQLTSLDLCATYRSLVLVQKLIVEEKTPPLLLWAGDPEQAASGSTQNDQSTTRVPGVRARGVTWSLPSPALASALLGPVGGKLFASVQSLVFGDGFDDSLDRVVAWPASLQKLRFGRHFNRSIDHVTWPVSLQTLVFGDLFNQSIDGVVAWPVSLTQLTFGHAFNEPIDRVNWPACLLRLTFDHCFNRPIDRVSWPASLQQLELSGYRFNHPIDRVNWPASLQQLTFGFTFNQSVDRVAWPSSLQQLTFGNEFDVTRLYRIVRWPASLKNLTLARPEEDPLPTWPGVRVLRGEYMRCVYRRPDGTLW